jgi:uroporphyrinogen-III synthase
LKGFYCVKKELSNELREYGHITLMMPLKNTKVYKTILRKLQTEFDWQLE